MGKQGKFVGRLQQVRALMQERNIEALRFTMQKNVSWLIGGRTHVNTASEPACCQVIVTGAECVLIANNIEKRRLIEEEIAHGDSDTAIRAESWLWCEPGQLAEAIHGVVSAYTRVCTDIELEGQLLLLRTIHASEDTDKLLEIGRLTADAIEQAAFDVERGDTEFRIAGKLAMRCWERGLEPIVNLIATDERIYARRHPLPTGKTLDRYAMLVVCTRKDGIVLSATRLVHFGPVPDELQRLHRAVIEIDVRVNDATKPGISLAELFEMLKIFYEDAGYAGEYVNHHQGGLTGYASREKIALPSESLQVKAGNLFAWNPSLTGVKSEDTLLVQENSSRFITVSGNYPLVDVKVGSRLWQRPGILERR